MTNVSIVIPVFNEEENISIILDHLIAQTLFQHAEVIVVDGGSTDKTVELAKSYNGVIVHTCLCPSRAKQMNEGAAIAKGEILYFVHADTIPPKDFLTHIYKAADNGYRIGCFTFKFVSKNPMLAINSYCTRFDVMWCRGGDQTLFVTKELFNELNGYDENYCIMEEYDFMNRARVTDRFAIIRHNVKVSARKYKTNSWLRVQLANMMAVRRFSKGWNPELIKSKYKKALNPY